MKKSLFLNIAYVAVTATTVMLGGCGKNLSPNTYSERQAGEATQTFQGVVVSMREVMVEGSDHLQDNVLGGVLGATAGGFGGSFIGKGKGNIAAIGAGAIAGGVAGAFAEKELKKQKALEYVVRLRSGEMRTVVQGLENPLAVGQPVLLMVGHAGRSRVVPAQGY